MRAGAPSTARVAATGLAALGLATVALGCGEDGRPAEPARDRIAAAVARSGDLARLALTARGRTTELPLVRDCADLPAGAGTPEEGPSRSGVIAPRCQPVPKPPALPRLEVRPGDLVEVTTGEDAAVVSLAAPAGRGVRLPIADARPVGGDQQRWRARLPSGGEGRIQVSVSPMRTDSGSLGFAFESR